MFVVVALVVHVCACVGVSRSPCAPVTYSDLVLESILTPPSCRAWCLLRSCCSLALEIPSLSSVPGSRSALLLVAYFPLALMQYL